MKKLSSRLLFCLSICFLFLGSLEVKANRAAAGEISWTWISDSTYKFTYKFYRDCGGATAEPASVNICFYNTCNTDRGNATLNKKTPLSSNGTPVQNSCAGTVGTTCTGGTQRGFREWVYEGNVKLPSKCDSWHFLVSIASRNGTITNYDPPAAGNNLFVEATLNNVDAPQSSSPTFKLPPIQYLCTNVPQNLPYGGVDADGDVLSYSLIDPATSVDNQTVCTIPPAPSSYVFGSTLPGTSLLDNPFQTGNSFKLNATSGNMSFTPAATAQLAQLCLLITKTRGGKVVGSVMRDMQFVISSTCTVPAVKFTQNPIKGVLPSGDSNIVCPNVQHEICFDITSVDPATDIFITDDNHLTFSKTAGTSTMSAYAGQHTNSVSGCFKWTPDTVDEGTKYLVINSTVCKAGNPIVYRKDTIKIYTAITVHASKDDTVCYTDMPVTISVSGGLTTFAWATTVPGSGIAGSTVGITSPASPTTDIVSSVTTTYLVECTDCYNGCKRIDIPALSTNMDEVKVIVVNPKIDVGPDTTTCVYSTLNLNANLINPQPELTYAWKWSTARPQDTVFLTNRYIVNPTVRVPAGMDVADVPDSIIFYLNVIPSLSTCQKQDTLVVRMLKGFYITTGDQPGDFTGLGHLGRQKGISDTAICTGQTITIVGWGDQRYANYIWTPGAGVSTPNAFKPGLTITPTGTTTYTLTAFQPGCRDTSKQIVIRVEPIPTANAGPDRTICFGDTINMFAAVTPDPGTFTTYTYNWAPGGSLSRTDTLITYFTGYITEEITFTVKTPAGCTGTDKVVYTVQPRSFMTSSPADTSICPGDTIQIHAAGDALFKSVKWYPQDRIDTVTSLNPRVAPMFSTSFVAVGLDSNSCVDSTVVQVNVLPRAVVYLQDSVTIYPGQSYQMSPEGNALYYSWFPGTGLDFTDISNPTAKPVLNTTYILTAKTDQGCTTKDSIYVIVAPDSYIDMANAFAPGQGENGVFRVLHLGDATLTNFVIYNRWGAKMFETKNLSEGWDGSFGGQPQSMGVYVYMVEAITANGKKISKQGNVTLIR